MTNERPRDMLARLAREVADIFADRSRSLEARSPHLHAVLGRHAALLYADAHGRLPVDAEAGQAVQELLERIAVQLRAYLE